VSGGWDVEVEGELRIGVRWFWVGFRGWTGDKGLEKPWDQQHRPPNPTHPLPPTPKQPPKQQPAPHKPQRSKGSAPRAPRTCLLWPVQSSAGMITSIRVRPAVKCVRRSLRGRPLRYWTVGSFSVGACGGRGRGWAVGGCGSASAACCSACGEGTVVCCCWGLLARGCVGSTQLLERTSLRQQLHRGAGCLWRRGAMHECTVGLVWAGSSSSSTLRVADGGGGERECGCLPHMTHTTPPQ